MAPDSAHRCPHRQSPHRRPSCDTRQRPRSGPARPAVSTVPGTHAATILARPWWVDHQGEAGATLGGCCSPWLPPGSIPRITPGSPLDPPLDHPGSTRIHPRITRASTRAPPGATTDEHNGLAPNPPPPVSARDPAPSAAVAQPSAPASHRSHHQRYSHGSHHLARPWCRSSRRGRRRPGGCRGPWPPPEPPPAPGRPATGEPPAARPRPPSVRTLSHSPETETPGPGTPPPGLNAPARRFFQKSFPGKKLPGKIPAENTPLIFSPQKF